MEEMIVVNFIFVYQLIVHSSEIICMIPKKKPGYLPGVHKFKSEDHLIDMVIKSPKNIWC